MAIRPNAKELANKLNVESELMQITPNKDTMLDGLENSIVMMQDFILDQKAYIRILELTVTCSSAFLIGRTIAKTLKK